MHQYDELDGQSEGLHFHASLHLSPVTAVLLLLAATRVLGTYVTVLYVRHRVEVEDMSARIRVATAGRGVLLLLKAMWPLVVVTPLSYRMLFGVVDMRTESLLQVCSSFFHHCTAVLRGWAFTRDAVRTGLACLWHHSRELGAGVVVVGQELSAAPPRDVCCCAALRAVTCRLICSSASSNDCMSCGSAQDVYIICTHP